MYEYGIFEYIVVYIYIYRHRCLSYSFNQMETLRRVLTAKAKTDPGTGHGRQAKTRSRGQSST